MNTANTSGSMKVKVVVTALAFLTVVILFLFLITLLPTSFRLWWHLGLGGIIVFITGSITSTDPAPIAWSAWKQLDFRIWMLFLMVGPTPIALFLVRVVKEYIKDMKEISKLS